MLKACPFCGGEAVYNDCSGMHVINCTECGIYQEHIIKEDVYTLWNTRTPDVTNCDDPLAEALVDMVNELDNYLWTENTDAIRRVLYKAKEYKEANKEEQ